MAKSERNVKTGINSEIHASLRRLEEADYVSEMVQSENLQTVNDQLSSKIKELQNEAYQLHTYMEPHIFDGDLKYFQNIMVGNLQVDQGAKIVGDVLIAEGSNLTVNGIIRAEGGMVASDEITAPSIWVTTGSIKIGAGDHGASSFDPHSLTISGKALTGTILATQDLSLSYFDTVNIADVYTIGTAANNATYAPRTITVNGTTLSGRILATRNIVIDTTT